MEYLKKETNGRKACEALTKEFERITIQEHSEVEKLRKFVESSRKANIEVAQEEEKNRMLKEFAEKQRQAQQSKLLADAELRYITAWESARCEQVILRCDMEIQELEKTLEDYRTREKNERRVHTARTNFLTQHIASIEKKIEVWQARYDRQKKMYERDIWSLQVEIDRRQKILSQLTIEHRRNQEFIDAYQADQEARRKRLELEEYMRRSAITIQAWWRGVMVRRKLGPYRPEEKKRKRTAKTKK